MSDTFYKNQKSVNTKPEFGSIFVSESGMAGDRNNKSHVRDRNTSTISVIFDNIRNRFHYDHPTTCKKMLYQLPLSAKIAIIFLGGIETFVLHNQFVEDFVTIVFCIGCVLWLCSYAISVVKKNLILMSTGKKSGTTILMRTIAKIGLQADIDMIIIRCAIIAAILVTLVIINSK